MKKNDHNTKLARPRRPRRPRDANQLAKAIVGIATEKEDEDEPTLPARDGTGRTSGD